MKPKTLILMIIAVACGLAASFMTSRVLSEKTKTEAPEEKVLVLVARSNLSQGTGTKDPEKLFAVKRFVKGEEPKKAIHAFVDPDQTDDDVAKKLYDKVKDRRLNKSINADQWVSDDDLMDQMASGLAAVMPKGMRAVAIKVDSSALVGGFVLPNSRVDVVFVQRKGDADSNAKVILQNVLVLAVGTQSQRPEDKQFMIEGTVTVAVNPEQAEKLALCSEMGSLRLMLRPFGDEEVVKTAGANPKGINKSGEKGEDATAPNTDTEDPIPTRAPAWTKNIPDVKAEPASPVAAAAETVKPVEVAPPKLFTMTIHNGESIRRVKFALGDDNAETTTEITKSPVDKPAPAPKVEAPVVPPALPATGK